MQPAKGVIFVKVIFKGIRAVLHHTYEIYRPMLVSGLGLGINWGFYAINTCEEGSKKVKVRNQFYSVDTSKIIQ